MKIEEVQSTTKKQRVATHTHIKGLGLEVFYSLSSFSLFLIFLSLLFLFPRFEILGFYLLLVCRWAFVYLLYCEAKTSFFSDYSKIGCAFRVMCGFENFTLYGMGNL